MKLKSIPPLGYVTLFCILLSMYFIAVPVKSGSGYSELSKVRVEALKLERETYPVLLYSRGTVEPQLQTVLIPQVSGRIIKISENFEEGGFFDKDEALLTIEPDDYETGVIVAKADLARVKTHYAEELARSEQAAENWRTLRTNEAPSALALRKPQLEEAKANVESAGARLQQALKNLERTVVRAPYAGRVMIKRVDLGQYVSQGSELGKIYATQYVEVSLPLRMSELPLLNLPQRPSDAQERNNSKLPHVTVSSSIAGKTLEWDGKVVRTDGQIDPLTRQLHVIARIDSPFFGRNSFPLSIGTFVEAKIKGRDLEKVFRIPKKALRPGGTVLRIKPDNTLENKKLEVTWSDEDFVYIETGFTEGERIVFTNQEWLVEGVQVEVTKERSSVHDPEKNDVFLQEGAGG